MDDSNEISISVLGGIGDISQVDWDACACPETGRPVDPFTTYRFLKALEDSGSVGGRSGWQPRHLVARRGAQIIGVMPLYAKAHSQGEYIFDHNWAQAWQQAGGKYYPKLQGAVPFTPATGRRFLTKAGEETVGRVVLAEGTKRLAMQGRLSSVHVTFCARAEFEAGPDLGFLQRVTQQYHWVNESYVTFQAFLAALSSRKRKAIRKERNAASRFGGQILALTGDQIAPKHWDAFWAFYQDTGSRKWGTPYLTRAFFDQMQASMREDILLVLAERAGRFVAGALNFIGRDSLYGRYWGCLENHPCLHFELCYYRAIDWAIEHGLARVEAGAQGEHKLARGYLPVPIYSLHWIADPGFRRAVGEYLQAERDAVGQEIDVLVDRLAVGEKGARVAIGRSKADAPEIDGVVYVTGVSKKLQPGEFLRARVVAAQVHDLVAELAS